VGCPARGETGTAQTRAPRDIDKEIKHYVETVTTTLEKRHLLAFR
jgi:hypothetical protein